MEKSENKSKTKSGFYEFIPAIALTVASIVCLCIYVFVMKQNSAVRFAELAVAPLIALVIPVLNRIFKINVPFALNVAVSVFVLAAIDFASVLDFYTKIPYFDKVLHTLFGVIGAFGMFVLLLYGRAEKLRPWCFFLIIMLSVLGLAAFWEIYEYTASAITGHQMQGWMPNLDAVGDMTVREFFASYDPLWDTIWDIIVAAFGVCVFYLLVFLDKLCGYKVCKSIYRQVNEPRKKKTESEKID